MEEQEKKFEQENAAVQQSEGVKMSAAEREQARVDRAMETYAALLKDKVDGLSPKRTSLWIADPSVQWPKTIFGRDMDGANALMLMLHAEANQYSMPQYVTYQQLMEMNKGKKALDAAGNKLPNVAVRKGEKSFPMLKISTEYEHYKTKERIDYDAYSKLDKREQRYYDKRTAMSVTPVWNVEQTTLPIVRKEQWAALEAEQAKGYYGKNADSHVFNGMAEVLSQNGWSCPVHISTTEDAKGYYNIKNNEIVVPAAEKFMFKEDFLGEVFHEMIHSTGSQDALRRVKPDAFGQEEQSREELLAELGAAILAHRYGMVKRMKSESAEHLADWSEKLGDKDFVAKLLKDIRSASYYTTQRIDQPLMAALAQGKAAEVAEALGEQVSLGEQDRAGGLGLGGSEVKDEEREGKLSESPEYVSDGRQGPTAEDDDEEMEEIETIEQDHSWGMHR